MKTVVVGMSGGVDSSVTAYLLKQQGYRVVGVSFLLYEARMREVYAHAPCCSLASVQDAGRTAAALGVEHSIINLRDGFSEQVIEPFVKEYIKGLTPNPCILCNRHIKFPALLKHADEIGAEYIATGHYARIEQDGEGHARLKKGVDDRKDQSYVLYMLTPEILDRLLLPLGKLRKEETRAVARLLGLPAAERPESQEICFIPDGDYTAFVCDAGAPSGGGPIVYSATGKVVGQHEGIHRYTIGQRKRLPAVGHPVYVTRIDAERRTVVIGPKEDAMKRACMVRDVSWIVPPSGRTDAQGCIRASAKVRSMMPDAPATVCVQEDRAVLTFDEPQWAPAPGQSAVFYDGDTVLGGGVIKAE